MNDYGVLEYSREYNLFLAFVLSKNDIVGENVFIDVAVVSSQTLYYSIEGREDLGKHVQRWKACGDS